jgi:hypothetical protein
MPELTSRDFCERIGAGFPGWETRAGLRPLALWVMVALDDGRHGADRARRREWCRRWCRDSLKGEYHVTVGAGRAATVWCQREEDARKVRAAWPVIGWSWGWGSDEKAA